MRPLIPPHRTLAPLCCRPFSWQGTRIQACMLIDSGADANFLCSAIVRRLGVLTSHLTTPLQTNALTGAPLASVDVMAPVHLLVSGNHKEKIVFYVIKSPHVPLVLGSPWLQRHSTHIDWIKGIITGWSAHIVVVGYLSGYRNNAKSSGFGNTKLNVFM